MKSTDFDDLLESKAEITTKPNTVDYRFIGAPITVADIKELGLSEYQYEQLSQENDDNVIRAGERAALYLSVILARLGKTLNLDEALHRSIAAMWTVYELHMSLGHEEAGREWRAKVKDLIIASFGSYPTSQSPKDGQTALGALAVPRPRRHSHYDYRNSR